MDILSKPRELERNFKNDGSGALVQNYFMKQYGKEMDPDMAVNGFSWRDCSSSSAPFKVKTFSMLPDPIKVPGNVTVEATVVNGKELDGPIQVDVRMWKRIVFWIPLPCKGGMGSCSYPDMCKILSQQFPGKCPPVFARSKLPCHCPLKPGQYSFPRISKYINPAIPGWLRNGDYNLIAQMSQQGQNIGCIQLYFSLA